MRTGGCLCGKIRFEMSEEPIWAGFCHCSSCRKSTRAVAVMHVGVSEGALTFTKGKPKVYESSPGVRRGFCGKCGTPLMYDGDRFPDYIQLYIGTFDEPSQILPQAHVHFGERVAWYDVRDDLPRFERSAAEDGDWR